MSSASSSVTSQRTTSTVAPRTSAASRPTAVVATVQSPSKSSPSKSLNDYSVTSLSKTNTVTSPSKLGVGSRSEVSVKSDRDVFLHKQQKNVVNERAAIDSAYKVGDVSSLEK